MVALFTSLSQLEGLVSLLKIKLAVFNLAQTLADEDAQRRHYLTFSLFRYTADASQSFFLTGGIGPSSEFDCTRFSSEDL